MKPGRVLFILKIFTLIIILFFIDYKQLVHILGSIDSTLLAAAFFLELAGFIIWAAKWKILVDRLTRVKFSIIFLGLMSNNFLNTNVLRARSFGGFGRANFLKNITHDHSYADCYATVAIDQTTNNFIFSIPVIFSLLFLFFFVDIPIWLSLLFEAAIFSILFIAIFAYISKNKINRSFISQYFFFILKYLYDFPPITYIRDRFETYRKFEEVATTSIGEFIRTYKSIIKDKKILTIDLFLSAFMFSLIYVKTYLIFQSTGFNISALDLIVSNSLILWIISIFPIPGGLGIKELVMIGIYTIVGVPLTTAAIVSMVDRVIYLLFVIIISYSAIFIMKLFHIGAKDFNNQSRQ